MRSRRLLRCGTCGLNAALCVCELLPTLRPRTQVVVVAHRTELHKSTNTGKLAVRMLEGATLRARGDEVDPALELPVTGSFLLFPSPDARLLSDATAAGVSRLIVPDGTWTQAKRIARRDVACQGLPCVRLEAPPPSAYRLRRNARDDGLCTLEAVAEALRVLEGDALAEAMLEVFRTWVHRAERLRAGDHGGL